MSFPLSGFGFLFGFIVLVGTASVLEKFRLLGQSKDEPAVSEALIKSASSFEKNDLAESIDLARKVYYSLRCGQREAGARTSHR